MSTSTEVLCRGFPDEFAIFLNYTRSLRFYDKPDYAYMRKLFRDLFVREGFQYDYVFDWTMPPRTGTSNQSAQAQPISTSIAGDISIEKEQYREEKVLRELKGVDEALAKTILNDIVVRGDEVQWDDIGIAIFAQC